MVAEKMVKDGCPRMFNTKWGAHKKGKHNLETHNKQDRWCDVFDQSQVKLNLNFDARRGAGEIFNLISS